jgi:multicomponent K+:H+ antiporter subunit D
MDALQSAGRVSATPHPGWMLSWALLLGSSLLVVVGLSRAGMVVFWQGAPAAAPSRRPPQLPPAAALLAASPLLVLLGGPLAQYLDATALQLRDGRAYIAAVTALEPAEPTASTAPAPTPDRADHGGRQ